MPKTKRVVVTGGGTAGHVVPAIPVIERLLEDDIRISFVGSKSGLEERLLESIRVDFHAITTGKLRRYFSVENLLDFFRVFVGIAQAFNLLRKLKPMVVFSKGGYVAFPVVVGAWLNRIPVVAHESDVTPGLANRLSLPFIRSLCLNFPNKQIRAKRVLMTGTPLREHLMNGDAGRGRVFLGVGSDLPILLVVGGSLGAQSINDAVRDVVTGLTQQFFVVHVCGPGNVLVELSNSRYRQFEYINEEWGDVLAAADLVVSRAGANALFELLALRKTNLLIPLSRKASRGDQIENAVMAESHGWSLVLWEENLNPASLMAAIEFIQRDPDYWRKNLNEFQVPDSVNLIYEELAHNARSR